MSQLKGKSHEEIEGLYYRIFKSDKNFIPMDSQKETEFLKRHGTHMESSRAKKSKVEELQAEKLTEE